jgi:hypothetical protein
VLTRKNSSVVFLAASNDACALWRLYMPHVAMPGTGFFSFEQDVKWDRIAGYDTVVVQRCCTMQQFDFLRTCIGIGIKIVYDLDDNVWEIPEYNPARNVLHRLREGFVSCIRMVNVVSVSTKQLAQAVVKHVGARNMRNAVTGAEIPIVVVENRMEERLFSPPAREQDQVIVGWAGSSSHIGDLGLVEQAVLACSQEFPGTTFEFRGCVLAEDSRIRTVPGYSHKVWMPVAEYAARMPQWGWSVALAPVTDIPFNASKSCIKMVEAGYCEIPCLASWVAPYDAFCSKDPELRWLLCLTSGQWETKLRILLNEPERRKELGRRMRAVVAQHYSLATPHEGWEKVFNLTRQVA